MQELIHQAEKHKAYEIIQPAEEHVVEEQKVEHVIEPAKRHFVDQPF